MNERSKINDSTPKPAPFTDPLPILYLDDTLAAVYKPPGLLVHRSAIDRHETRFALQLARNQLGRHVYPTHRLDKPTDGVLLFALDPDTARLLSLQFQQQQVTKTYRAIVRGYTELMASIDYPLAEQIDKMTDRRSRPDKAAQPAITDYRRLATIELPFPVGRYRSARYSLLEITPRTGRKHQIRRHMKHIFHPVVGDTTHGDGKQNTFFRTQLHCRRLLLTAQQLRFTHPHTRETLEIDCRLEPAFNSLLEDLDWQYD